MNEANTQTAPQSISTKVAAEAKAVAQAAAAEGKKFVQVAEDVGKEILNKI